MSEAMSLLEQITVYGASGTVLYMGYGLVQRAINDKNLRKRESAEKAAIRRRPKLQALFNRQKKLGRQRSRYYSVLDAIYEVTHPRYHYGIPLDQIIPLEDVRRKRKEAQGEIKRLDHQVSKVEAEMKGTYRADPELMALRRDVLREKKRWSIFPFSLLSVPDAQLAFRLPTYTNLRGEEFYMDDVG
ncbi:MAG TPA: hypothetical protein VJC16_07375 [Candidatus Nanoarchaeia archaeon]|nr:hypothetical protein [Candidatus Nanoarchaeia archaeon]